VLEIDLIPTEREAERSQYHAKNQMDGNRVYQALTTKIGELGVSFRLCSAPNAKPNTVLDLLVATAVTWI
jgi:hypothetical protein